MWNKIGWRAKITRRGGENASCTIFARRRRLVRPAYDCHQMTFPATRCAARIKLWFYVTDMLCRSRVQPSLLGEDSRKRRKSSLLTTLISHLVKLQIKYWLKTIFKKLSLQYYRRNQNTIKTNVRWSLYLPVCTRDQPYKREWQMICFLIQSYRPPTSYIMIWIS